jgi:hypothetical protein
MVKVTMTGLYPVSDNIREIPAALPKLRKVSMGEL